MRQRGGRLTVLFTPLDGWGHINANHGFAEALRDRGHRVVFAVDAKFEGKLKPFGFEEEIHRPKPKASDTEAIENGGPVVVDIYAELVRKYADVFKLTPIEIIDRFVATAFGSMLDTSREREEQYRQIIAKVNPDVIVVDSYIGSPTLTHSGKPWVWLYSAAPHLCVNSSKVPPGWSGLPLNGNREEWTQFKQQFDSIFTDLYNRTNKWYKFKVKPSLDEQHMAFLHPVSPYLNIYMYPKELDYEETHPLPEKFRRVDGFVRTTDDTFEIPEQLVDKPGKLIFLSMGSFGCANMELMTRITGILAKSEHRYIVSKGPLHDKYELPDNMWGSQFLPQTAVLPLVDLVITHGGNNTVTETFFYGKPMLVLPLFGDQFDNAQRLEETGLGLRLNPFNCTDEELLSAVDQLVNDSVLSETMASIGERIRKSNDKEMVAKLIEQIAINK
ncbi:uncharacterized protein LOC128951331 [Oppia nitens]|uniref:uncharacterized protein LOC128951331 n=1 Tax=Oppia nitens TaxID=1686743 RepID=UPI0023DC98FA|nr:uncharacterized protein LOC128951331 [Oppia nitens]